MNHNIGPYTIPRDNCNADHTPFLKVIVSFRQRGAVMRHCPRASSTAASGRPYSCRVTTPGPPSPKQYLPQKVQTSNKGGGWFQRSILLHGFLEPGALTGIGYLDPLPVNLVPGVASPIFSAATVGSKI